MKVKIFETAPLSQNCYLVYDEVDKLCAVIDPGGSFPDISSFIDENGLKLTAIILTHGHYDHTVAVSKFKEKYSAPVYSHEDEVSMLSNPELNLSRYLRHKDIQIHVDCSLKDEDSINIGHIKLTVIHTPGHTPGSCCYYSEEQCLLFSGDTLFRETVGRTDFQGGDMAELKASIKRLLSLPDVTEVLPGHNEATTIGHEKQYNPFAL